MSLVTFASGTVTTDGTEQFLSSPNETGVYTLTIDLSNMASGDIIYLRQYAITITGGTARLMGVTSYSGAQSSNSLVVQSVPYYNALTDTNSVRYSIQRIGGTDRSYAWRVTKLDDGETDLTTILTRLSSTRAGNLDYLDAAITTRLAGASYTAPDNAGIAAIQNQTDQLVFTTPGRVDASATVSGTPNVNVASIASNAVTAAALAADAVTEIQSGLATGSALVTAQTSLTDIQGRLPAALTGAGNIKADALALDGSTSAAGRLRRSAEQIVYGAAVSGTLSTTQMSTNLTETVNNHHNGKVIYWTSGVLANQATDVTGYNGSTKVLTFTAVTSAPQAGDTFVVI